MKEEDLCLLIDKMSGYDVDVDDKKLIIDKVLLYNKHVEILPITLLMVVDSFIKLEKIGCIDKIDNNLFVLMKRILNKKEDNKIKDDDVLYFLDYLNYIVVPSNIINCDKEYNLPKFLGEFEIFVTYIEDNLEMKDINILLDYNVKLE